MKTPARLLHDKPNIVAGHWAPTSDDHRCGAAVYTEQLAWPRRTLAGSYIRGGGPPIGARFQEAFAGNYMLDPEGWAWGVPGLVNIYWWCDDAACSTLV